MYDTNSNLGGTMSPAMLEAFIQQTVDKSIQTAAPKLIEDITKAVTRQSGNQALSPDIKAQISKSIHEGFG